MDSSMVNGGITILVVKLRRKEFTLEGRRCPERGDSGLRMERWKWSELIRLSPLHCDA